MGAECNSGTWGRGQSGGPAACSGYMKAGGPIHIHGAGGAATYSG